MLLFDLITLGNAPVTAKKTCDLLSALFSMRDVVKVGWQFQASDIDALRQSSRGELVLDPVRTVHDGYFILLIYGITGVFEKAFNNVKPLLELEQMERGVVSEMRKLGSAISAPKKSQRKALSEVCAQYLGKPLLKREQVYTSASSSVAMFSVILLHRLEFFSICIADIELGGSPSLRQPDPLRRT